MLSDLYIVYPVFFGFFFKKKKESYHLKIGNTTSHNMRLLLHPSAYKGLPDADSGSKHHVISVEGLFLVVRCDDISGYYTKDDFAKVDRLLLYMRPYSARSG